MRLYDIQGSSNNVYIICNEVKYNDLVDGVFIHSKNKNIQEVL